MTKLLFFLLLINFSNFMLLTNSEHFLKFEKINYVRDMIPPHVPLTSTDVFLQENLPIIFTTIVSIFATVLMYFIGESFKRWNLARHTLADLKWMIEDSTSRVSQTVCCKIRLKKESGDEHRGYDLENLLRGLVIYVRHSKTKECVVPWKDIDWDNKEVSIKFSVRKSGLYEIQAEYDSFLTGFTLGNSPFEREFLPGPLFPLNCYLDVHNQKILSFTYGKSFQIGIVAKDRYENICLADDIDLSRFKFKISEVQFNNLPLSIITIDELATGNTSPYQLIALSPDEFNIEFVFPNQNHQIETSLDETVENKTPVAFKINCSRPGIFLGEIRYNNVMLATGQFTLLSVTQEEEDTFVSHNEGVNTWKVFEYDCQLITIGSVRQSRAKSQISVSSRCIIISDQLWGIIAKKVLEFRVSKRTTIEYHGKPEENKCRLMLRDNIQGNVVVDVNESDARLLILTFAHYQGNKLRYYPTFNENQSAFQNELCGYFRLRGSPNSKVLKIIRGNIIETTLQQSGSFSAAEWCRPFLITFESEKNTQDIATSKQWFNAITQQIFGRVKSSGMFCSFGDSSLVHPTIKTNRHMQWENKHYELAGKILGKSLFDSCIKSFCTPLLNTRFSRSFLAQLLGLPVTYYHMEQDDQRTFQELFIPVLNAINVADMNLTFTVMKQSVGNSFWSFATGKVNLIPNGSEINVTEENKEYYLNTLASYLLAHTIEDEMNAVRKGFYHIVPLELLMDFNENELELLLCGTSEFKSVQLKKYHRVGDSGNLTKVEVKKIVGWFLTSVANMSSEEKARLLQLTMGSCILPPAGFKDLDPPFTISTSATYGSISTAQPCLHEICLADDESFENFEKALLQSIYSDLEDRLMYSTQ